MVTGDRVTVRGLAFQGAGIDVFSDGVRVEDCTFQRFPKGGAGEAVIQAGGDDLVVSGNDLGGTCVGDFGIRVIGDRGRVTENRVAGRLSRAGISVRGEGCTVEGNGVEVPPGTPGIEVEGGAAVVLGNRVAGADLRVYGDGARIEGNTVADAVLGQASFLLVGSGGVLREDAVTGGQDTGFLVVGDGNAVEDCSVEGNGSVLDGTRVGHGFVVRGSGNLLARDTATGCASQAFRIVGNGDMGLVEDPFTGAWDLRAVPLGPGNRIQDCTGTGAGTCGLGNGTLGTVVTGCVFTGNGIDVIAVLDFEEFAGNTWTTGGPSYRGTGEITDNHDLSGSDLPGQGPAIPGDTSPAPGLHPLLPGDFTAGPTMVTGRAFHTASLLPGGNVLLAGGQSLDGTPLAAAEVFDRAGIAFEPVASLADARRSHAATGLKDGRVLACGGFGASSGTLASVEIYDPGARRWRTAAPMSESRASHTATLLGDGPYYATITPVSGGRCVLLGGLAVGGAYDGGDLVMSSIDVWDPLAGFEYEAIFGLTFDLAVPRAAHTVTALGGGLYLVAGGLGTSGSTSANEDRSTILRPSP